MRGGPLEITDLMWSFDGEGQRLPVVKADVVATLLDRGQVRAGRIVDRMPDEDGVLDENAVDALGLSVHRELQRLGEELQLGRRVAALVQTLIPHVGLDDGEPIRLVDVGCGLGHVLRSIAHRRDLPPRVELLGVDLNPVLIAEANRLAELEGLDCRFATGDPFAPGVAVHDGPRTIVVSTGLLHHLDPLDLEAFFARQAGLDIAAFAHWDITPCLWSTLGAWVFHRARMREAVSRHDGVLSARRAHPVDVLLSAARGGASAYQIEMRAGSPWHPRVIEVLRPFVGIRR